MPDNIPKPVASGNFTKTPFTHILLFLWEQQKGGTLRIVQGERKVSIYFREGTPAKVRSNIGSRDLKTILLRLGFLTKEQVAACEQEYDQNGGLQGQILVRQGALDPPSLIRGLREQMLLKLTDVFALTGASYEFYDKVNMIVGYGPDELFPIDPYPVLMAGLRIHSHRLPVATLLDALKGKWIYAKEPDNLRRFRVNKAEKEILEELLADSKNYDAFIDSDHLNLNALRYVTYALVITKLLVVENQAPVAQPAANQTQHASKLDSINPLPNSLPLDPMLVEKKEEILAKATAIPSQNYYEMLGVRYGAPHEEVRTAFFKMAKTYHPDKIPNELADELKDTVQYIFSNLQEAHATLIDPDSREEYESAVKGSAARTSMPPRATGDEAGVKRILDAENFYQKALVFLRRNQLEKAKRLVDKAIANNPSEGEYQALWAHLESHLRPKNESVDDLVNALRQAAESHPRSERVHLFFAQILKKIGSDIEAREHLKTVVKLNPANIDAQRELRLMDIRKKSDQKRQSGFLGKLFN